MNSILQIKNYVNKNDIDIAFVVVIIGLVLVPVVPYSWIASIIALLFVKEDIIKTY